MGLRRRDIAGAAEEREEAFDPETRMMATFHKSDSDYRVVVKGAPEAVLENCKFVRDKEESRKELTGNERDDWLKHNSEMADEGLRVLALATKYCPSLQDPPYSNLIFVGLVAMHDPPREGVQQVLDSLRTAGVRVIMATGDHAGTAACIARSIGMDASEIVEGKELSAAGDASPRLRERITRASVFARVSPKQKLDLIRAYQETGSVVAMTGDGVNDAPALKKADIGIAMGQRGTEVAREASDMVLRDDSLKTIVAAIEQGRVIFVNIRTFVIYLLSCNLSEVLTVGLFAVTPLPLPILPIQILFLNLLTDVFPALALGLSKGDPAVMHSPPRPANEPVLMRQHWLAIAGYGLLMTVAVAGAFAISLIVLDTGVEVAVTISFLTLALAQLLHVFNMIGPESHLFRNEVTQNPFVWGAMALCIGLLLLVLHQPVFAEVLHLTPPDRPGWEVIGGMASLPLLFNHALRALRGFGGRLASRPPGSA
jgi:Ca2+-transporting ATPase